MSFIVQQKGNRPFDRGRVVLREKKHAISLAREMASQGFDSYVWCTDTRRYVLKIQRPRYSF